MPYKLRITNEEVENEMKKMGFEDFSEEMVESFRKDLLKLIKTDLKKLKKLKETQKVLDSSEDFRPSHFRPDFKLPSTSTPSSQLELELDKEKVRYPEEPTSEYETYSSASSTEDKYSPSEGTSKQASSISSETSRIKLPEDQSRPDHEERPLVSTRRKKPLVAKKEEELPSYPEKADPVNLYHYYKAYWDKYKVPGEDPRNALRWGIRSKLFYASKDV